MYFGANLQFLRRRNGMTQEMLSQHLGVSRQAVSKWESGETVPEVSTLVQLAELFHCSLDTLLRQNLILPDSPIRVVTVKGFRMARYCVISPQARDDVQTILSDWAIKEGLSVPTLLLLGFSHVTEEQKIRFSMEGFEAVCVLPQEFSPRDTRFPITAQPDCTYAVVTIPEPEGRSSARIAQGIRTILETLSSMGIRKSAKQGILPYFERRYIHDGVPMAELYLQCQGAAASEEITII